MNTLETMNETPTPITDAAEKSPFQHAVGCPPPNYMSVESGIVRDLECCLSIARTALKSITHDMGASQNIHKLCAETLEATAL